MKDIFVDVNLELDLQALGRQADPAQYVLEASRDEADALCARSNARLRTDRAPEVVVQKGQNRITGQLCLLVASRWAVVAPEDVEMKRLP